MFNRWKLAFTVCLVASLDFTAAISCETHEYQLTPQVLSDPRNEDPRTKIVMGSLTVHSIAKRYLKEFDAYKKAPNLEDSSIRQTLESNLPLVVPPFLKPRAEDFTSAEDYSHAICLYHEKLFIEAIAPQVFPDKAPTDYSRLTLIEPSTPSRSGAFVYLVQDMDSKDTLAAFKIQSASKRGLQEILNSSAAEKLLRKVAPDIQIVRTLAVGQILEDDYFVVQSPAPGLDFEHILKDQLKVAVLLKEGEMAIILKRIADMFSVIHMKAKRNCEHCRGNDDPLMLTIRRKVEFETEALETRVLSESQEFPGSLQVSNLAGDFRKSEDYFKLKRKIRVTIKNYRKLARSFLNHNRIRGFLPTLIHGDAHGGNIFIDRNGSPTLIDYAGFMSAIKDKHSPPVGDPANDIGRMVGYIQFEALRGARSIEEAMKLSEIFMNEYKQRRGILKGSTSDRNFNVAVELYRSRFFGVKVSDRSWRDVSIEMKSKLFKLWLRSVS